MPTNPGGSVGRQPSGSLSRLLMLLQRRGPSSGPPPRWVITGIVLGGDEDQMELQPTSKAQRGEPPDDLIQWPRRRAAFGDSTHRDLAIKKNDNAVTGASARPENPSHVRQEGLGFFDVDVVGRGNAGADDNLE